MRPSLAHLLILSASQDVKFEFLVKSRVDQVKEAMTYLLYEVRKQVRWSFQLQRMEDKD